jgi:hypothetical protein
MFLGGKNYLSHGAALSLLITRHFDSRVRAYCAPLAVSSVHDRGLLRSTLSQTCCQYATLNEKPIRLGSGHCPFCDKNDNSIFFA